VARVCLEEIRKSYGSERVVDIPALEIADGEFFSLLGPSGCGKTTTIRSIAGSVPPDSGRVFIGDREVTTLPPHRRNVGMVFQKYALFPHLTVAENVAYGLENRGFARDRVAARVAESLELVALRGFDQRYPHQLSGGQQQRVATARAIAYRPDVLLLDEPFSSLDARLRSSLRTDFRQLQRTLGLTTVFVTHDQQEALGLSDRLAVMNAGRIDQIGTPEAIYESPSSAFVADFVGGTNLVRATVVDVDADGSCRISVAGAGTVRTVVPAGVTAGTQVTLMIKPERVRAVGAPLSEQGLEAEIASVAYLGSDYSYTLGVGGQRLEARQPEPVFVGERRATPGDRVTVTAAPDAIRVTLS
jgi:putative spermidine/putrescine transport system ATP-binding protein